MKRLLATAALIGALHLTGTGSASAQAQGAYLGEIRLFATNFCTTGFAPSSGQLLAISQNAALFSLLGTYFGGNGVTNFALPNLIGRTPYGSGTPGGQPFGAVYGAPTVTLLTANLPAHTHQLFASSAAETTNTVAGGLSASFPSGKNVYAAAGSPANVALSPSGLGLTGGNQPISIQSPALAMTWCIATTGIYPSRP
jgi:microcystin-dependent protein